jgi:hypothetical protein
MAIAQSETRALRATIKWSLSPQRLQRLIEHSRYAGILNLNGGAEHSVRLTLTDTRFRADVIGASSLGGNASLVGDREHLSYLAHDRKLRYDVPADFIPTRFESPMLLVGEPQVRARSAAGAVAEITVEERLTGRRYGLELSFQSSPETGALGVRLLDFLWGDWRGGQQMGYPRDAIERLVRAHGLPVSCTVQVFGADSGVDFSFESFTVTDVDLVPESEDLFAAPVGYTSGGSASASSRKRGAARDPRQERTAVATARVFGRNAEKEGDAKPKTGLLIPNPKGDGGPDPDPDEPPEEPSKPSPPPMSTAAVLGLRVDQVLLDDVKMLINRALSPLAGVQVPIQAGKPLSINWLELTKGDFNKRRPLVQFLFCLLHDVQGPAQPRGWTGPQLTVSSWGTIRGRGLLDEVARLRAQNLVDSGAFLSSPNDRSDFTPAERARVVARLSSSTIAVLGASPTGWNMLTPPQQLEVAFAILMEEYAGLVVDLPASIGYNAADLIWGELANYSGTFSLPPEGSATPKELPLITSLRCRDDGTISASLMVGTAEVNGYLSRVPGSTYAIILAASTAASFFQPGFALVVAVLLQIAVFIALDYANAELQISDLGFTLTLRFVPDAKGVMVPAVEVKASGTATAWIASYVPTGLVQALDMIFTAILNGLNAVLTQMESKLQDTLNDALQKKLGIGFFTALVDLDVGILSASATGRNDDHIYLESTLTPPPITTIKTVSVRSNTAQALLASSTSTAPSAGAHRYFSLASSQNTLNIILAALWRKGRFSSLLNSELAALYPLLQPPFPVGQPITKARITAINPPNVTLVTGNPIGSAGYATFELEGTLTLQLSATDQFLWTFKVTAPAEVTLGSATLSRDPTSGVLQPCIDIGTVGAQPLDILVNFSGAVVDVTALSSEAVVTTQVTETWLDRKGHPQSHTYTETDIIDTPFSLTAQDKAIQAPVLLEAVRRWLRVRNTSRSSRRNGIQSNGTPTTQVDPITLQSYLANGADPDDTPPVNLFLFRVPLQFDHGLALEHVDLTAGAALDVALETTTLLTCETAGTTLDVLKRMK